MKRPPIPILYQDEHLLIVNKPPRIASVPSPGIFLNSTVMGKVQKENLDPIHGKPYLLHRLDYDTSGILCFGKQKKDRAVLEAIFKGPAKTDSAEHKATTHKRYVALVMGIPTGEVITKPLPGRTSSEKVSAQTYYKVRQTFKFPGLTCALVEAEIKTGRKHQIRQHFASIGHPVALDIKYGNRPFNRKFNNIFHMGRQFLHAETLIFYHPFLKKEITVIAPYPPDIKFVMKKLGAA